MINIFILGIFENQIWRTLGCVCFGWKSFSEMLFGKCGCLVGPENRIFWKLISIDRKKMALTTEIILHFHFHFKVFLEKERERERACERKKTELQSSPMIAGEPRAPVRADLASSSTTTAIRDRDLVTLIAISPSWDRAVNRDRRRGRRTGACEAPHRRTQSSVDRWWFFFWVLSMFFWVCLFLLLFQTPENIFRKIFWNATKHMKTFSFPENSIFGKWHFPKMEYFPKMLLHKPNTA